MGLIAYRTADGSEVESFAVAPSTWNAMRREPSGTYRMPGTGTPAILKRSIRGLQFFAYRAGEGIGTTEPMTEAHAAAQIGLLREFREMGLQAWVEHSGTGPAGERWQADVFCMVGDRKVAIEVQLAPQTLEEFEFRTARYMQSGVECYWIVSPARFMTFNRAVMNRTWRERPHDFPYGKRPAAPNIPVLALELGDERNPSANNMRVAAFLLGAPPGPPHRLTLAEFASGIVAGRLQWRDEQWIWATDP